MNTLNLTRASRLAMLTLLMTSLTVGCTQTDADPDPEASQAAAEAEHDASEVGHDLHGYWCVEHGIPEDICAQCNAKVAAEYQQKGDWCEEHSRPDSQCFVCHPELAEKFAAQYEAKFGERPPAPMSE